MKSLLKGIGIVMMLAFATTSTGCIYSSVSIHGETALVAKSEWGGVMKHLYVCKVTPQGVTDCKEKETP